jgi:calcium/calmodulin-dependent protein kinase kinase 2
VTKHGDVFGKAADIYSMGVSLYCLMFGRIPFEGSGILELYEAIRNDGPVVDPKMGTNFVDLMQKILEKDPWKRITMRELR